MNTITNKTKIRYTLEEQTPFMSEKTFWRSVFQELEREYWKAYFQKPSPIEQRIITNKAFRSLGLTCKALYEVFPQKTTGYEASFYRRNSSQI